MLDRLYLGVFDPTVEDVVQTLVPHMRDFFRRDPGFQDRLGVDIFSTDSSVSVSVNIASGPTAMPAPELPVVSLSIRKKHICSVHNLCVKLRYTKHSRVILGDSM